MAGPRAKKKKPSKAKDPIVASLEEALASHFQTRASIKEKRGQKGTIEVDYHDAEVFERIFEAMTGRPVHEVVG